MNRIAVSCRILLELVYGLPRLSAELLRHHKIRCGIVPFLSVRPSFWAPSCTTRLASIRYDRFWHLLLVRMTCKWSLVKSQACHKDNLSLKLSWLKISFGKSVSWRFSKIFLRNKCDTRSFAHPVLADVVALASASSCMRPRGLWKGEQSLLEWTVYCTSGHFSGKMSTCRYKSRPVTYTHSRYVTFSNTFRHCKADIIVHGDENCYAILNEIEELLSTWKPIEIKL